MAIQIRIIPPQDLHLSDPQQTELGRKILSCSIRLMNDLGLENFTFRKLSGEIGSTEASIYRYFSNKHQLLLYLVSWYWDWVHHLVNRAIARPADPTDKLRAAIRILTRPFLADVGVPYINQYGLHQLIINEGTKVYRTKLVDQKNNKGLFLGYKGLTAAISELILGVRPGFTHPRALASSIFEMAHDHPFFAEHLSELTDLQDNKDLHSNLEEMLWLWLSRLLEHADGQASPVNPSTPLSVFITRQLKPDSPLRTWALQSGNVVNGHSFLNFEAIPFEPPKDADWWFFYSSRAVKFCFSSAKPPENVRLAAMGTGTAQTLRKSAGRVDFTGEGSPGQVANQFQQIAAGQKVFFPRAKNSYQTIQKLLATSLTVCDAVCYDNSPIPVIDPVEADVFIFTSPLNVKAYLDQHPLDTSTQVLAIGGSTAAALYQRGQVAAFPQSPSEETLAEFLNTR